MHRFVNCKYKDRRGHCKLNRVDGEVSPKVCAVCLVKGTNKIKGLGDLVALAINSTPFRRFKKKNCGCKKRQDYLNRIGKNGN